MKKRLTIKVTRSSIILLVLFVLLGAWATRLLYEEMIVVVVVLLAIFLSTVIHYRGRTFWQWLRRSIIYKKEARRGAILYAVKDKAVLWDGEEVAMYIGLKSPDYCLITVGGDNPSPEPRIPFENLAPFMRKDGVNLASIRSISQGWNVKRIGSYAAIYEEYFKGAPRTGYFTTAIEVRIALKNSLPSVYARSFDDGVPEGLSRLIYSTTEKVERSLNLLGLPSEIMSVAELVDFNEDAYAKVGKTLVREGWDKGKGTPSSTSYFATRWTKLSQARWFKTNSPDVLITGEISAEGSSPTFCTCVTYTNSRGKRARSPRRSGLDIASSQQGNVVTHLLPLVKDSQIQASRYINTQPSTLSHINIPAYGLGTLLGELEDGGSLFLNLSSGGRVYLQTPEWFVRLIALRLSSAGLVVNVDSKNESWKEFVQLQESSFLVYRKDSSRYDVLVTSEEMPSSFTLPKGKIVLVHVPSTSEMPQNAQCFITGSFSEYTVTAPIGYTDYKSVPFTVRLLKDEPDYIDVGV